MQTSYKKNDVILLLKDITGMVCPEDTKTREKKIQSGVHYCEMLPVEYRPSDEYSRIFHEMVSLYGKRVADAVSVLSERIALRTNTPVLVSLARAGIPAGIMVKHYLEHKYDVPVTHYSVSIIRGRGIDRNAMRHILNAFRPKDIVFIDGWTGKGAIKNQLSEALHEYKDVPDVLGVIADPAGVADIAGTTEDLMIPSACLNSTVSGLISRTFLRDDIIGPDDFHGAVYYEDMKPFDLSYEFIHAIERHFDYENTRITDNIHSVHHGMDEVNAVMKKYSVSDINLVKPGLGETIRVLLRRVPDIILINPLHIGSDDLKPILRLAREKSVPVKEEPLLFGYKTCGIIRNMADA